MKLFNKNVKKKPLTDKAKEERKQKMKHIIKRILDILMYGFAILMAFALAVGGACSSKVKVANATYHSDAGYTSINSVVATANDTTNLRFYYDYNFKKTFPKWDTLFDVFYTSLTSGQFVLVRFENSVTIDNVSYSFLGLYRNSNNQFEYRLFRTATLSNSLPFVTLSQNDTTISRSDILTTIFNGVIKVKCLTLNDNYINWFKYLTYYFGELGYNRLTVDMPVILHNLNYLYINSDQDDTSIENGYFIKNDTWPTHTESSTTTVEGWDVRENVFLGSFRSNGVYYTGIELTFSSVRGNMRKPYGSSTVPRYYYIPGRSGTITSNNEFYNGYYYLDTIAYTGYGARNIVWQGASYDLHEQQTDVYYNVNFANAGWVGDTYTSTSPFRDIYVYYANDSLSGTIHNPYNDTFPQLNGLTFAQYLNFIAEVYPSINSGQPYETTPVANIFEWLRLALAGAMPMFSYTILPGITIGTLIMVPLVMSVLLFLIKLFKR